jgi:RimJ/RimL family protein N-acetyltransferase
MAQERPVPVTGTTARDRLRLRIAERRPPWFAVVSVETDDRTVAERAGRRMDAASDEQLGSVDFALVVDGFRLRPWNTRDAPIVADIVSEPSIPRWTFLPYDMTVEQAAGWIEDREAQRSSGSGLALAIGVRGTGEVLGCVGLAGLHAELGPEAYYWLGAGARGRGVATRTLGRVCRWAFDVAGVSRVRLFTEPDNLPSCRVAERVGFVREGRLRRAAVDKQGRRGDLLLYGLLPEELRA